MNKELTNRMIGVSAYNHDIEINKNINRFEKSLRTEFGSSRRETE